MAIHHFDEDHHRLLPRPLEALLVGWMRRLAGIVLLVFCIFLTFVLCSSLASDVGAPSWPPSGHVFWMIVRPVKDVLAQAFGIASPLALICLAVWGAQLALFETIDRFRLRAIFALISLLTIAGGAAALPTANGWLLESGYGGLVGDLSYDLVAGIFAQFRLAASGTLSGLTLFAIGFWAYAYALDIDGHLVKRFAKPLRKRVDVPAASTATVFGSEDGVDSAGALSSKKPTAISAVTVVADDETTGTADRTITGESYGVAAANETGDRVGTDPLSEIGSIAATERDMVSTASSSMDPDDRAGALAATLATYPSIDEQSASANVDVAPSGQVVAIARRFAPSGTTLTNREIEPEAPISSKAHACELDDLTFPAFLSSGARQSRADKSDQEHIRPPPPAQDTFEHSDKHSECPSSRAMGIGASEKSENSDHIKTCALVTPLNEVLDEFCVTGSVVRVSKGPAVTRIDFELSPGINPNRVVTLADDIARVMKNKSVRVSMLNGARKVGFELAHDAPQPVAFRPLLQDKSYRKCTARLPLMLGCSVGGEPIVGDLTLMPNLLITGVSAQSRAKLINALLLSLLYRSSPDDCRMLLVGEVDVSSSGAFGGLAEIPHLLAPPIEGAHNSIVALDWLAREMRERYTKIQELGEQDIASYNNRLRHAKRLGEKLTKSIHIGFDQVTGRAQFAQKSLELERLPYIVVVVNDPEKLAENAGENYASAFGRISSLAEKVGVHLIVSTGQAEHDCVVGALDKLRLTRLCLKVASKADSRAQLGEAGAEHLLDGLDFIVVASGGSCVRGHGPEVRSSDLDAILGPLVTQKRHERAGRLMNALEGAKSSGAESMRGRTSSPTAKRRLDRTGACS
ncbi:MAG: DNA translocase FtsK 4TM domain-containing protein [Hyphomicrobiaceae bacterium]